MQGLDVPIANPLFKKPDANADGWGRESNSGSGWGHEENTPLFNPPRRIAPGSGILRSTSSEIPSPEDIALADTENAWKIQSSEVPPALATTNPQHDDWEDQEDGWEKPSKGLNVPLPPQSNIDDSAWDETPATFFPPPPGSVAVNLNFYSSNDLNQEKRRIAHANTKRKAVDDDWNENQIGKRSISAAQDKSSISARLKRSKSGMDFPLLKDDDSVDLVRDELAGRQLMPREWTVADVKEFVMANGYGVQGIDLAKAKVDGEQMMGLSRDKLAAIQGFQCYQALSVSKLFHRLRTLCKPPYDPSFQRSFSSGRGDRFGNRNAPTWGTQNTGVENDSNGWNNSGRGRGRGRGRGFSRGRGGDGGFGGGRREVDNHRETWNSPGVKSTQNEDWETPNPVSQSSGSGTSVPKQGQVEESWETESNISVSTSQKSKTKSDDNWDSFDSPMIKPPQTPSANSALDDWGDDPVTNVDRSNPSSAPADVSGKDNTADVGNNDW